MGVDADSTVIEIIDGNPIEATDDDIAQWVELDNTDTWADGISYYSGGDAYVWQGYTGLFWMDMSDFFTDCATADDCSDDYETDYSEGCAMGMYMYTDAEDYANVYDSLADYYTYDTDNYAMWCFEYTYGCVGMDFYYDGVAY